MSNVRAGKPAPEALDRLLAGHFGKPSKQVLVGPGPGLDAAILDIGGGRVMAIAEDPIFPAPNLPLEIMGFFTVHIGASDVAVTGIKPEFMTYTLLMPPDSPLSDAELLIRSISDTAESLDITIAGGHTGWYGAVTVPIVGGVTIWGTAPKDQWVSPGGAKHGDVILMTKGPSIEAAALLGVLYKEKIRSQMDSGLLDKVCARTNEITVVEDALTAFKTGGVHAMHDATEGGVLGGLWEMQASSGLQMEVTLEPSMIPEDIEALSKALEFDPWLAISEGTLLAAVRPESVKAVQSTWKKIGIPSYVIGRFDASLSESRIVRDGQSLPLPEPQEDPFWRLFFAGLEG
jgi:hydrogenase expression/formation protein HypE